MTEQLKAAVEVISAYLGVPAECLRIEHISEIVGRQALAADAVPAEPAGLTQVAMRDVVAVAVTMLYDTHKDDVLSEFGLAELSEIVAITEPLMAQRVESIYRRAWDSLAAAPQPASEPQPAKLPDFAAAVAQRKWDELKADGWRMARIEFERPESTSTGSIDPSGVVTWRHQERKAGDGGMA